MNLLFLQLLAGLLAASSAPALGETKRNFTIGGQPFSTDEIVDARALPEIDGTPQIMITFSEDGAKRLAAITRDMTGKTMTIALDGKAILETIAREPLEGGVVNIVGLKRTLDEAAAMAKLISGKDPLPDSLEE